MKITMPCEAEWIIGKIRERGYEAFAVGGCVRDTLLGRLPEDWDITTSAKPEEVKAIFGRTVDTGLQHGTVTVMKHKKGYEVTTYRIDGEYHDGRHPDSVAFTSSLREDLKRRDFTINAMAYSHETGIVDVFGGMEDLKRKTIRCVGCAADRFGEDALRILRAIRFAAQLDFSIEEKTWEAVCAMAQNLSRVSRERVQTELTKLLLSCCPEKIVMVRDAGISPWIASGFEECFGQTEDASLRFSLLRELPTEKSMRWAGFLRYLTPDRAASVLRELKLDNETIGNVKNIVRGAQTPLFAAKPAIRKLLSEMSAFQFDGCLRLKALDGSCDTDEIRRLWREIREDGDCVSLKTLAVSGRDLLEAGVAPGPEVGKTLSRLLALVLEDPSRNRKEFLLERL